MINLMTKWSHLPWHHWNNPIERYKELPTFVIGEYLIFFLTIITLIHARRHGREHMLVWIASLITGSANDIFFMALPLVDNFWQAQATIMITPRLPLYIPCVYICFLYISTVTVWRLQLSALAEAAATGLLALLIYGPYDIIGAKFLWWTWHDTDPPVMNRLFGAPIGSSMWILTFSVAFTFLVRVFFLKVKLPAPVSLFMSALTTTPLMMVAMAALQAVACEPQGAPGIRSYILLVSLYVTILGIHFSRSSGKRNHPNESFLQPNNNRYNDSLLNFGLLIYFTSLFLIIVLGTPEFHVSTGIHQTYGKCGVKVVDFSGLSRHQFVCSEELDEDYALPPHCANNSSKIISAIADPPTEWYTVCGKAHVNYAAYLSAVSLYCFLGHVFSSFVLGHPFRSRIVPFDQSAKKTL